MCRKLSLWLSNGTRKDLFWRSAMSGGRSTIASKGGDLMRSQAGDIVAVDRFGLRLTRLFLIECKHKKNLGLKNIIYGKGGEFFYIWDRLLEDCEKYEKQPMLLMRQNFVPDLIVVNRNSLMHFHGSEELRQVTIGGDENIEDYVIMLQDELFMNSSYSAKPQISG